MTAGEHVKMQMKDGLAGVPSVVDDHAITGSVEVILSCDLLGRQKKLSYEKPVIF